MFGNLSEKFENAMRSLSGQGKISETNVREAMEQVREALLEADVHYEVVEQFNQNVLDKALGQEVLSSVKPGQQMIKIVHDELVRLLGGDEALAEPGEPASAGGAGGAGGAAGTFGASPIMFVEPGPTVIMMAGLQGSGKTTTCGKLAAYLKKRHKKVMLAAADLQRPAAVHQLEVLTHQVNGESGTGASGEPASANMAAKVATPSAASVAFYAEADKVAEYGKAVGAAVTVCRNALKAARAQNVDVLILDTAGRLHIDDSLMDELRQINQAVQPHQIYLVIDAMTGQDAVNSARAFNEQLELDGVILTKFDSDTRGGAALSVRQVTGKPIKFIGTGEKLDALEPFHAERLAGRILGMGDIVSLVEKAQEQVSEEEAVALQEKMAAGKMTMDDFLKQLKSIRKMGSMKSLLGMLPGIGNQLKDLNLDERQIDRTEAIIQSMTRDERKDADLINNSRRRRIAQGSGTQTRDVSQLVKGFEMVSQMGRQLSGMGMMSRMKALAGMGSADMAAMASRSGAPRMKAPTRTTRKKFKKRR